MRCPPPGDERTLLDLVAAQLGEPLPPSRPPWSAMFVTGLADGGTALLVIMDHVLADGVAGLAVLAALTDQAAETATARAHEFPAPAPRARELAVDAWRGRLRRANPAGPGGPRPPRGLHRIREGSELGGTRPPGRRPVTSLNQPVGPRRRLDVIAADLAALRDLGRAHGGTGDDLGNQIGIMTLTVPARGDLGAG